MKAENLSGLGKLNMYLSDLPHSIYNNPNNFLNTHNTDISEAFFKLTKADEKY